MPDASTVLHDENTRVAEKLNAVADLLEHQNANRFRIRAYRDAAKYVAGLSQPIGNVLSVGGRRALEDMPTIGPSIAAAITEILQTGDLRLLDNLRGDQDPEKLFQTVPQIGPALAAAIHRDLGIDTLEDLELAANDGRLAELPGFGPRRVRGIQYALDKLLARRRSFGQRTTQLAPPVPEVLDVDSEYRMRAEAGELPMIAPKRFNPNRDAWLPIMHTERGDWNFTVLYSNTLRAHQLHRTHDWVVVQYDRDSAGAGQCTVVTEQRGELAGQRVIRGYEAACAHYYADQPA
jgi:hypothetical protein